MGDLYVAKPDGDIRPSTTDHFATVIAPRASVLKVLRRGVRLTRTERRTIERLWKKADKRAERITESTKVMAMPRTPDHPSSKQ